jgi:hypothetical protein
MHLPFHASRRQRHAVVLIFESTAVPRGAYTYAQPLAVRLRRLFGINHDYRNKPIKCEVDVPLPSGWVEVSAPEDGGRVGRLRPGERASAGPSIAGLVLAEGCKCYCDEFAEAHRTRDPSADMNTWLQFGEPDPYSLTFEGTFYPPPDLAAKVLQYAAGPYMVGVVPVCNSWPDCSAVDLLKNGGPRG